MSFIKTTKELVDLVPSNIFKDKPKQNNNKILVTGGAGFLGIHLLKSLVEQNRYEKIYTIVRNKNKIKKQAEYYHIDGNWIDKVEVIEGDLLDLKEDEYPDVQYVIHSAAEIHAIKSYEQLWINNVLVTEKVSSIYKNNDLFYISTLSVFVSSNQSGNHKEDKVEARDDYQIYGGYAQTKYIGEKIIERNKHKTIRLGLITASTENNIFPNDFFSSFIKISKELKVYPEEYENAYVDVLPVDICVKKILKSIKKNKEITHIANKESVSLKTIIKELNLVPIEKEIWFKKIEKYGKIYQILLKSAYFKNEVVSENIRYYNIDLFQSTHHSYNIKNKFNISNKKILTGYINGNT